MAGEEGVGQCPEADAHEPDAAAKERQDFRFYGTTKAVALDTMQLPPLEERIAALDDPDRTHRDFIDHQPLGQRGTREETAALAVHLCSDENELRPLRRSWPTAGRHCSERGTAVLPRPCPLTKIPSTGSVSSAGSSGSSLTGSSAPGVLAES